MADEPRLSRGDQGEWVEYLQRLLEHAGHQVQVTGAFDDATSRAVAAYQEAAGLSASGDADEATWNSLRGGSPSEQEPTSGEADVAAELIQAGAPASLSAWSADQRSGYFTGQTGDAVDGDGQDGLEAAPIENADGNVATIVNTGATSWQVIANGGASSEIYTSTANAVPSVDDWQNLTGARGPKAIRLRQWVTSQWPFPGAAIVDYTVVIKFEYGATYRGGGLFVPNIYVEVAQCHVGWGYSVDLRVEILDPSNQGSESAPISAVPVRLSGTIANADWSENVEWNVKLLGNGNWDRS